MGNHEMARLCTICTSPDVRAINAQLATGAAISTIVSQTSYSGSFSDSALRRHAANHLGRIRDIPEATTTTTDLLSRLQQALDDVDRVRSAALATAKGDLVVKAAATATRIIETFMHKLGIDDVETARLIEEGHVLARAVARATRQDPAIGYSVARELLMLSPDDTTTADAIEALAVSVEQKLELNK